MDPTFDDAENHLLIPLEDRYDMSKTGGPGTKFSIASLEDGTRYVNVDTDQHIFAGMKPKEMLKYAQKVIKERFVNQSFALPDGKVSIDSKTAGEYSYSSKRSLKEATKRAKAKASTELDNLIKISELLKPGDELYPNESYGHKLGDGVIAMKYYSTLFKVNGRFFTGVINVEVRKNGNRLKDITQIKLTQAAVRLKV